jgi:hypothetical protein
MVLNIAEVPLPEGEAPPLKPLQHDHAERSLQSA